MIGSSPPIRSARRPCCCSRSLASCSDARHFLDIAIAYALINFITTIALMKFFRYRSLAQPSRRVGREGAQRWLTFCPGSGGGLVLIGVLLSVLGAVGVLRFPDVYTRIHAASITDTGGAEPRAAGPLPYLGAQPRDAEAGLRLGVRHADDAGGRECAGERCASAQAIKPRVGAFQIMRTDERRKTPRGTDQP